MESIGWDLKVLKVIEEERITSFKKLLTHKKLKGITKSTLSKVLSKLEKAGFVKIERDKKVKIKGKGKPLVIYHKDFEPLELYVLSSILRIVNRRFLFALEESLSNQHQFFSINQKISIKNPLEEHRKRLREYREYLREGKIFVLPERFEKIILKHEKDILVDVAISYGKDPNDEDFVKKFYKIFSNILKKIRRTKEYEKGENLYPLLLRLLREYRIWYVRELHQRSNAPGGI